MGHEAPEYRLQAPPRIHKWRVLHYSPFKALMGLGHLISRHLHCRVHPINVHNSAFISMIMAFIFRYYLWATRHQSIAYKLPREYTNGRCYTTPPSRPYGIGSSYFLSSTPPCSPLTWPPSYSTNRTHRRSNNPTVLNMVTIL